jgi:membrane-associated protein
MEVGAYVSTFGGLLTGSSLVALFVIMLLKEIGVPVPVPADLLMISAGVQVALGQYTLLELAVALEIAVFLGCSMQFFIVRGIGRQLVYRIGRFVGLSPGRLDGATARLQRQGPLAVFVGLNLPGVRAGMIIAAGLAGMRYLVFAPAMIAGSTVFYGWHIALGYLVGPAATNLLENLNLPLVPVLIGVAILGLLGWLALHGQRKVGAPPASAASASVKEWTEAACPACLAVTALQLLQPQRGPDALGNGPGDASGV